MTPEEYRRSRESLYLNQGALAEKLGIALNTVSRRELGQLPIPREAELAMFYLLQCQEHAGILPRGSAVRFKRRGRWERGTVRDLDFEGNYIVEHDSTVGAAHYSRTEVEVVHKKK